MPLARRPLLDFPIVHFQMLDDGSGDLVLFIVSQRPAHSAAELEPPRETHQDGEAQIVDGCPHASILEQTKNRRKVRPVHL